MFGISKYIIGALLLLLLATGAAFHLYFKYSQGEIKTLTENNAKLTTAVETQRQTILSVQNDLNLQKILARSLEQSFNNARAEIGISQKKYNELAKRSGQASFASLAANKPVDLQEVINQDSNKLLLCMAIVSGKTKEDLHLNDKDFKLLQDSCRM